MREGRSDPGSRSWNRLYEWPGRFSAFLLPASIAFGVVVPSIGRLLSWTDNGELVAAATVMGISHPTGYPLFALLSRVTLLALPWFSPVVALNLFSAACISMATGMTSLVISTIGSPGPNRGVAHTKNGLRTLVASATGALIFLSIVPVWKQAISYEVYALQCLLYSLVLYSTVAAAGDDAKVTGVISRWWVFAGLMTGFGFANHMMTLFLLPGLLFLGARGGAARSIRRLGAIASGGIVGVSFYLFLPIRASANPPMNWGDPSTAGQFFAHVSGRQYRVWMFTGLDAFLQKGGDFIAALPETLGWIGIVLMLAGHGTLWKKHRHFFWFLVILEVFTLLYSFNYDIHDIDTYFTLFYLAAGVTAGLAVRDGLAYSERWFGNRRRFFWMIALLLVTINFLPRRGAYPDVDAESPEPFARYLLTNLRDNATVVTAKWDFLYSPILALQLVEGLRPDVRMVDYNLLRDRAWYVERTLERWFGESPDVSGPGKVFLAELRKFESGALFSRAEIGRRWKEFLGALLAAASERGPVYADHTIVQELPLNMRFVPEGYLLVSVDGDEMQEYEGLPEYFDIGVKSDDFAEDYRLFCSTSIINHGLLARSKGDSTSAHHAYMLASRISSTNLFLSYLR